MPSQHFITDLVGVFENTHMPTVLKLYQVTLLRLTQTFDRPFDICLLDPITVTNHYTKVISLSQLWEILIDREIGVADIREEISQALLSAGWESDQVLIEFTSP